MATITPIKIAQGAIGTTLSTFYTVPASSTLLVKDFDICNTTAATITITMYLVPSGGTAGSSNMIVPAYSLPANAMMQWAGTQVLNAGDFIQIVASAVGSTINISGGLSQ